MLQTQKLSFYNYSINGKRIKNARVNKNYTQEQLSELCGVSRSQIQRIESSSAVNCTINTFFNLVNILGIDLYTILTAKTIS